MKKFDKSLRQDKMYRKGVKDSLRFLYATINGMEYGTGFAASAKAQAHSELLKHMYNQMHMTLLGMPK